MVYPHDEHNAENTSSFFRHRVIMMVSPISTRDNTERGVKMRMGMKHKAALSGFSQASVRIRQGANKGCVSAASEVELKGQAQGGLQYDVELKQPQATGHT